MKPNPCLIPLLVMLVLGVQTSVMLARTAAISDLAGQWQGTSRFTGISYAEAVQKKIAPQAVAIRLHISTNGQVSGWVGGAELLHGVVAVNRGWWGRRLHLGSDFILHGQMGGAVAPGSENGIHPISAPFNFADTQIGGTLFVIYPVKYPYPFLSLRLSR